MFFQLFLFVTTFISLIQTQGIFKSKCPSYGSLNYRCISHDYCNKSIGLVCGDGHCGFDCPLGWISYGDGCYYMSQSIGRLTAFQICSNLSSKMLTFKSRNETFGILKEYSKIGLNPTYIWLSAFVSNLLEYTDVDGNALLLNDSLWTGGEPNRAFEGTEPCVVVSNLGYFDASCEKTCQSAVCNCGKDQYYDTFYQKCIPYGTLNECCEIDEHCHPNKNLLCINSECVCSNGTTWDQYALKCRRCGYSRKLYKDKCYIIDKTFRTFSASVSNCIAKNAKLLEVSPDDEELKAIIEPYRSFMTKIWINATRLVNQYPSTHSLYCGNSLINYNSATHAILADRDNIQQPYCITHDSTSGMYQSICVEN